MVGFITTAIERQAKISIEKGQAKYKAYFVNTQRYLEFKDDVDTNLRIDGFEECIVEK